MNAEPGGGVVRSGRKRLYFKILQDPINTPPDAELCWSGGRLGRMLGNDVATLCASRPPGVHVECPRGLVRSLTIRSTGTLPT